MDLEWNLPVHFSSTSGTPQVDMNEKPEGFAVESQADCHPWWVESSVAIIFFAEWWYVRTEYHKIHELISLP